MDDHILWMNGIDCGKCFRPANHHNFLNGIDVPRVAARHALPDPPSPSDPHSCRR